MTLAELKAFKQVYEKKSARLGKGVPQLGKVKDEVTSKRIMPIKAFKDRHAI